MYFKSYVFSFESGMSKIIIISSVYLSFPLFLAKREITLRSLLSEGRYLRGGGGVGSLLSGLANT